ncbi:MAG TPA: serine protease [Calditrichaeota bacterium]|nr:serine protease [Calditrichota bacterium]
MNFNKSMLIIWVVWIFAACSQKQTLVVHGQADGEYDSEFPSTPITEAVRKAAQSVILLNSLFFYQGYEFDFKDRVTTADIRSNKFPGRTGQPIIYEQPSAGTATLIYNQDGKMAFLTCSHTVNAKDTLLNFYKIGEKNSEFLSAIFILVKKQINLVTIPGNDPVEILAADDKKDIALIGKKVSQKQAKAYSVFPYKLGYAGELDWAKLVYVIGYPYGKKMVTQALVSSPNYDWDHSFLIDATLYRGVSGAVVMAIRDGAPNFELVGIARALSAETLYYIGPEDIYKKRRVPVRQEYSGKLYIEPHLKVAYGLTFTVSAEAIREFFSKNRANLEAKGYYFPGRYFSGSK